MRTEKRTLLLWSGVLSTSLAALVGGVACSQETEDPGGLLGNQGGSTSSGFGGAPSVAGTLGSGAVTSVAGRTNIMVGASGTAGASMGVGFEKCATDTSSADLKPVSMFIQFDRSGSMLDNNKWEQAANALNAFFTDAKSDGLKVALRFFPDDNPVAGCQGGRNGACDATACAQPLVPLGALLAAPGDPQEAALLAAIAGATPTDPLMAGANMGGGTPIYPALQGALTWAATNQQALPNERVVVVLVTDGEPNGCDTNITNIAALATEARMGYGVNTYAIGIEGSRESTMNQIARAGGTERAYFSSNAQTAQQDLLMALNDIRGNVLACNFPLPAGDNLDTSKINIQFTGADGMAQPLTKTTPTNCASGGWYYNDEAAPTEISLCESTCQLVQGTGQAKIDVVIGCETMIR